MSGKHITDQQIIVFMRENNLNKIQEIAAAKSWISERSGHRIDTGELTKGSKPKRQWRTRKDPLFRVWDNVLAPMFEEKPLKQDLLINEDYSTIKSY